VTLGKDQAGPRWRIIPAEREHSAAILDFLWRLDVFDGQHKEFSATAENVEKMFFSARPCGEVLMAIADAKPVGFIVFSPILFASDGRGSIYVTKIFVEDAFRGRGIGHALLAACRTLARERGLARLVWGVMGSNVGAIEFYRREGAQEIAGARWFSSNLMEAQQPAGDR
jgi:ribosomal protein S18 acetylase RimI-like enzyme